MTPVITHNGEMSGALLREPAPAQRCKKDNRLTLPRFDVSTPSTEWIFDLQYRDAQRISLLRHRPVTRTVAEHSES